MKIQDTNKTGKLVIKKGWFYIAGSKWGWIDDGYEMEGVGINRKLLKNNHMLDVEVEGKTYRVICSEAIQFIRKYKSYYKVSPETMIGVISKSLCK